MGRSPLSMYVSIESSETGQLDRRARKNNGDDVVAGHCLWWLDVTVSSRTGSFDHTHVGSLCMSHVCGSLLTPELASRNVLALHSDRTPSLGVVQL